MAKFLSELEVELREGTEGGRSLWELVYPLGYQSDLLEANLVVPPGFTTDFASIPRVPVVYLVMNDVGQKAAVLHDYLYSTGIYPRSKADAVLEEALKVLGVSWWRRKAMWLAVRAFGWGAYKA